MLAERDGVKCKGKIEGADPLVPQFLVYPRHRRIHHRILGGGHIGGREPHLLVDREFSVNQIAVRCAQMP